MVNLLTKYRITLFLIISLLSLTVISCGSNDDNNSQQDNETAESEKRVSVDTLGLTLDRDLVERYDDGSPRVYHYYQDEDDYLQLKVWRSHKPYVSGWFRDGERQGDWFSWYENGVLWSSGRYEEGLREGKSEVFYDSGNVRIQQEYKNGKPHGTWVFYDKKSNKTLEVDYDKGKKLDERRY
ncbi:MAG TPA: hypothetical protein VJ946_07765 [Bacteroidales bacterium]|nr:hypothetical protein [Bacteroidales bacterium]